MSPHRDPVANSATVRAASEETAVVAARIALVQAGRAPIGNPLYIEDLHDGTYEVVFEHRALRRGEFFTVNGKRLKTLGNR